MAKPVQVRPLVSSGSLPANPLQYLEQLNRARSYQNAYVRAGWKNWEVSLAAAEKEMAQAGQNYRAKLDYLKALQDSLDKATSDLTALSKDRQQTLADLETTEFKAKEDRALAEAKLAFEAGKATKEQEAKVRIANLQEAADTARKNAELATRASIENAANRTRLAAESMSEAGRAGKDANPLKTFDINTELVNQKVLDFGRSGSNDPAEIRRLIDSLSSDIANTPGSASSPREVEYSLWKAYSALVDSYARQKGVSPSDVEGEVASQFADAAGMAMGQRIAAGKATDDLYTKGRAPTQGTPGTGAGAGGAGSIPSVAGASASKAGTPQASARGLEVVAPELTALQPIDRTIGQAEYDAALQALLGRQGTLQETIAKYTPLVGQVPPTDIIGRAQQLYAQKFTAPPVKQPKGKSAALSALGVSQTPDPLKSPLDPLQGTKASAAQGARVILKAYGLAASNPEMRKVWTDFEATDIAKKVRDMFSVENADPAAIQAQLSKTFTKSLDPVDLLDTEEAMKAYVIYNALSKQK